MRIITGKYKGRKLQTLEGSTTRPTTDFIKEMIFSVLHNVQDLSVLDLFSGSGSLAFEAISRGAVKADLVDGSYKAVSVILANMDILGCKEIAHVYKKKANVFLNTTTTAYDLIFVDPPYNKNLINVTLNLIYENNSVHKNGSIIVVEHASTEPLKPIWEPYCIFHKKAGVTSITILKLNLSDPQMIDEDEIPMGENNEDL